MANTVKATLMVLAIGFCLFLNSKTSAIEEGVCPVPTVQGNVKGLFEWDPNNPDTMSRETQVTVSVIGGKAPYIWSVSGSGFSLAESQTQGLSNTLSADETACGSAVITVTDARGTVEGSIRIPDYGEWVEICDDPGGPNENCRCEIPGPPNYSNWYNAGGAIRVAVSIKGKYKQQQNIKSYLMPMQRVIQEPGSQEAALAACEADRQSYPKSQCQNGSNCDGGAGCYYMVNWNPCEDCIEQNDSWQGDIGVCSTPDLKFLYFRNQTYATECAPCGYKSGSGVWEARYNYGCACTSRLILWEWQCN